MNSNDCKRKFSFKIDNMWIQKNRCLWRHYVSQGQINNVNNFTTFSTEWKLHGFQLFKDHSTWKDLALIKSYLKFLSFEKPYCSQCWNFKISIPSTKSCENLKVGSSQCHSTCQLQDLNRSRWHSQWCHSRERAWSSSLSTLI